MHPAALMLDLRVNGLERCTRKLTPSRNKDAHSSCKGTCWKAFTNRSRCRHSFETVCALTTSSVRIATTRPTCRVEMPRKNASRISNVTSAARR